MGKTGKKDADERLQEVRHKERSDVRYRKRRQQEQDADKQLKDYENRRTER